MIRLTAVSIPRLSAVLLAALLVAPVAQSQELSMEQTRATVESYLSTHDASRLAPDVVFIDMSSGARHEGREAVGQMLDWIYHQAFDARFDMRHLVVGEGLASIEGDFVGRHIGEFAGVAPTGRDVRVPLSVTYVVGEDGISEARIYMLASVMMAQLTGEGHAEH
jgi:predicted ester cyclase